MRRIPSAAALPVLVVAALGAMAVSVAVGPVPLEKTDLTILRDLRLARAVLAFCVGAALALSGVVFQGLFRNPLADPFVVGVSGGSALGAVAAIVLGVPVTIFWGLGSAGLAAFAGGLGATYLTWRLAEIRGRVPVGSLLLAGFAVGSFCAALVSILLLLDNENWNRVIAWLMGNLYHPDPWRRAAGVAPFLVASAAVAAWFARDLDLMLMGEEAAGQMGVEVERAKRWLLVAGSVAAAGAVAMCGVIGFVGLIVPHVIRRLVGPGHRALLPVTILAGGTLLVAADLLTRLVSPVPLPIGAVTALLGAPFFLLLLRRR